MVKITLQRGLPTVLADLMDIPFSNQSFAGVWAYTSLLHISKKKFPKALKEIHRVLIPNGVLGIGMIEGQGVEYRLTSGVQKPRLFALYSKIELEKLLTETGFSIFHFQEFQPGSKKYLNFLARKI